MAEATHCVFFGLVGGLLLCMCQLLHRSFLLLASLYFLLVFWSINKDCTQAATLYSFQCGYLRVVLSFRAEKVLQCAVNFTNLITSITVYNSFLHIGPVNEQTTITTPEIKGLTALTASQKELSFRLGLSLVIAGDRMTK